MKDKKGTIFVQIASYRDPECQYTVKDLFEKAKYPENIFVGICLQYDLENDENLFQIPYPKPEHVRVKKVDYRESLGVCWARHHVQQLWENEDYTLQIDSHTRFIQDWDIKAIKMIDTLKRKGVEKPVLSSHIPGYSIDGRYDNWISYLSIELYPPGANIFGMSGHIVDEVPHSPMLSAFVCAHFIFAQSEVIKDVPYDPHLYFDGEEITLSARLWTNGWNIYHPNEIIAYTLYPQEKNALYPNMEGYIRNLHIESENSSRLNEISFARVRHMFRTEKTETQEALKDLQNYGFGSIRTLEDYERFSGVNFRELEVREHTKLGIFYPFKNTLSNNKLILLLRRRFFNEQNCQKLMDRNNPFYNYCLRSFFFIIQFLNPKSILDISWDNSEFINKINLDSCLYIKADICQEITSENRKKSIDKDKLFITLNAFDEKLPKTDIIFCDNLLSLLPNGAIWKLLENIYESDSTYLITEHFHNQSNKSKINYSLTEKDFIRSKKRAVNLCMPPFFLPAPLLQIPAASNEKTLAIWKIQDIGFYLKEYPAEVSHLRLQLIPQLYKNLELLKTIIEEESIYKKLLISFFGHWEKCNEFCSSEPISFLLSKNSCEGYNIRNNIFRLAYKCELNILQDTFKMINKDNFIHAQILSREYLRYIMKTQYGTKV